MRAKRAATLLSVPASESFPRPSTPPQPLVPGLRRHLAPLRQRGSRAESTSQLGRTGPNWQRAAAPAGARCRLRRASWGSACRLFQPPCGRFSSLLQPSNKPCPPPAHNQPTSPLPPAHNTARPPPQHPSQPLSPPPSHHEQAPLPPPAGPGRQVRLPCSPLHAHTSGGASWEGTAARIPPQASTASN